MYLISETQNFSLILGHKNISIAWNVQNSPNIVRLPDWSEHEVPFITGVWNYSSLRGRCVFEASGVTWGSLVGHQLGPTRRPPQSTQLINGQWGPSIPIPTTPPSLWDEYAQTPSREIRGWWPPAQTVCKTEGGATFIEDKEWSPMAYSHWTNGSQ